MRTLKTLGALTILVTCATITASAASVKLSWNPPAAQTGVTITAYNVFRSTTPNGEAAPAIASVKTISGILPTTYTDANVAPGTYFYKISAYCNSCGTSGLESPMSPETVVVVPAQVIIVNAPPAPTAQVIIP